MITMAHFTQIGPAADHGDDALSRPPATIGLRCHLVEPTCKFEPARAAGFALEQLSDDRRVLVGHQARVNYARLAAPGRVAEPVAERCATHGFASANRIAARHIPPLGGLSPLIAGEREH